MQTGVDRGIVLDTSAYSWLRAGHEDVLDIVAKADVVWVPTVVLGELESGFELGKRARANRVVLEDFLSEPFVDLLPVTRAVARHYGRIFAALRHKGTPIPINDVWIAATALERGGCLLTFDQHFERIESLDQKTLRA